MAIPKLKLISKDATLVREVDKFIEQKVKSNSIYLLMDLYK